MRSAILGVVMGLGLAGCAYNAPVPITPNLQVYSSYGEPLSGKFALFVDGAALSQTVKPLGLNCSAHKFPVDLRDAFRQSVIKTVEQLVEEVVVVDTPLSGDQLTAEGYRGMILVRGESLNARLNVVSGFWSSTADSTVELSASLTEHDPAERVFGTTGMGQGNAQADAGGMCEGGATAIGMATEKAVRQLLGQLGERLSGSARLRTRG